jgi:hypothetical protein
LWGSKYLVRTDKFAWFWTVTVVCLTMLKNILRGTLHLYICGVHVILLQTFGRSNGVRRLSPGWRCCARLRTSCKSRCGSVSRSLGRTVMTFRYALIYFFSLYIIYVNYVLVRIWNLIFSFGHLRTQNRNPCWVTAGQGSQTSQAP